MFYDLSFDCYTFTCICIYTCSSNTLYVLVTRITGLNYTKEKQFLLTITYKLSVTCYEIVSGIYWIAVSFAWVLCGVNNIFKVKQYTGINKITLCNLNGEIELVAIGLCPNGVVFYANIYTDGSLSNPDQGAYIVAFTNTLPPNLTFITGHVSPTITPQSIVFRIPINYKFPVSNNKYYVPVKFGVTFF